MTILKNLFLEMFDEPKGKMVYITAGDQPRSENSAQEYQEIKKDIKEKKDQTLLTDRQYADLTQRLEELNLSDNEFTEAEQKQIENMERSYVGYILDLKEKHTTVPKIEVVTIEKGQRFYAFLKQYNTTLEALIRLNGGDNDIHGKPFHGKTTKGIPYFVEDAKIRIPVYGSEVVQAVQTTATKESSTESREDQALETASEKKDGILLAIQNSPEGALLNVEAMVPDDLWHKQTIESGEETDAVRFKSDEREWSEYMLHMQGGREFYTSWEGLSKVFSSYTETKGDALGRLKQEEKQLESSKLKKERTPGSHNPKHTGPKYRWVPKEIPKDISQEEVDKINKRIEDIQKEKARVELLYPEKRPEAQSPTTLFVECLKHGKNQKLTFNDITKTLTGMKEEDVAAEYKALKSKTDRTADENTRMTQLQELMYYSYKILRQLPRLSTTPIQIDEEAPRQRVEHTDERTEKQEEYDNFLASQLDLIFDKTDLGPKMKLRLIDILRGRGRDVLNMELLAEKTKGETREFSEAHAYEMIFQNSGEYAREGEFILNPDLVLRTLNTLIVQGIQGGAIDDELIAAMDYHEDRKILAEALQMYIDAPGNSRVEKTDYVFKNVINPEVMLATIQDTKLQELLKKYRESTEWEDWTAKWGVIVQYSRGKPYEEEVQKIADKAILLGRALNGANIDKFLLSSDFVDPKRKGTATNLQLSLIEKGFDYKTGAIDSARDKVETTRAAMAFCKEHYAETYPVLEAIINEAEKSGKDFSAEEMIKTGETVHKYCIASVGVLFDERSIYREVQNENGKGTHLVLDERKVQSLLTAQAALPLLGGLFLHGGLTAGHPDVGAGEVVNIGDNGAQLCFRVSWSPTTPGKETSASLGATIPLGDSAWEVFAGATLAFDDKGNPLPPPSLALAIRRNLGKVAQKKYETFQETYATEIDQAIATATNSLEGLSLTTSEKDIIRQEIYSYFAADMSEEALQQAVGGLHFTGAGLMVRVPLPNQAPPFTITPVLTFSIGGRTIIKRVRKDSEASLSLLSEARIEEAIREKIPGEVVFGDPLIKKGEQVGLTPEISVDSETGQYEIESYDSKYLTINPLLPLETYDREMNAIGIDLDKSEDGKLIDMEVKNAHGLVRVIIDPKMRANLIADPTGMHLSLDPTKIPGLVIRREDIYYPFNQAGETMHTVITITDNPETKRSTIETEMSNAGKLRYLQSREGGRLNLYGGREADNLYFFDEKVTEEALAADPKLKEVWEKATSYDLTGGLDEKTIAEKEAAARELMAILSATPSEPITEARNTELREFAQELIDHNHFRRESLTTESPRVLRDTIQAVAKTKFGSELNDREYNCVLGHATALSFRQLETSSGGNEETARTILQGEIQTFAIPTLTKRLETVVGKTEAKNMAKELLEQTYSLDENGRPCIDLLSTETIDPPEGSSREVLAGLDRAAGTRRGAEEGKLLKDSYREYGITSGDPKERAIAEAILELRSPIPESDKKLLRCPLALQVAPYLHRFFTAEHMREIVAINRNPDSADYSSPTFQNFKALIVAMRSAELDGRSLLVQAEDSPEFAIDFGLNGSRKVQTFAGLEMPCRNETIGLGEELTVRQVVRTEGVSTETVAHVGAESSKNYYEFGIGVGFRKKELTRPEKPIPPEETPPEETPPPPSKLADSTVIQEENLETWKDGTEATGNAGNP